MQIANRLESHKEVCTKSGLAINLARIQEQHKQRQAQAPSAAALHPVGADSGGADPSSGRNLLSSSGGDSLAWIPESYVLPARSADKRLYSRSVQV